MHLGYVTPESPFDGIGGGIASYLRAIIPGLLEAGHRVSVFTGSQQSGVERRADGRLTIHRFRLPSLHWYLSHLPLASRTIVLPLRQLEWSLHFYRVISLAARSDPLDVLEAPEVGGLFLHRIAPLVVRLHGSEYVFRRHTGQRITPSVALNHQLEKQIWRKASVITAPSRYQAHLAAEELGWPVDRTHAIPNPLASEILGSASQMTEADFESRETPYPIVLYSGRLALVKGTEVLLQAACAVIQKYPQTRFVLAGAWQMPGQPQDWGLSQVKSIAEMHGGIFWMGHIHSSLLIDWYRRATIFVMPSYFESFGISVAEAMAFGLPVVASRAGALPEIVDDGVTGFLVPPGETQAWAAAICHCLENPEMRREMGMTARRTMAKALTAGELTKQFLSVYQLARGGKSDSS